MAIKTVRIEPHSKEWHEFRANGIGGSEIGTILGSSFNAYGSRIKTFYEKMGAVKPNTENSEVMLHGTYMEDYIVSWWEYFDGDIESTMKNKVAGNIQRKCRKTNGYIVNDKYPWLFASPDRLIDKGQRILTDDLTFGDVNEKRGVLELKTINGFVARKYDSGIPPYNICQIMQYLTILELDYAELAQIEDGRHFYCVPVRFNQNISDMIIEKSFDFWHNNVLPAKELYKEYVHCYMTGQKAKAEKIQSRINELEPEVDSSDTTREFISARFNGDNEKLSGDVSLLNKSIEYKRLSKMIKKLSERKDTIYNNLMNVCVHNQCSMVELPNGGYYKMFRKHGSTNYQLTFSGIKHEKIDQADSLAETI